MISDIALVQVLKQDWPHNWPNFIPELVTASKTNESLCTNNMHILLLLSEEVFDYSSTDMTQDKMREMKHSLNKEIGLIYELCFFIVENSASPPLLTTTLQALQRYLSWIPIGYIMESSIIEVLVLKFFPAAQFQNNALRCLGEVANLTFVDHPKAAEYGQKFQQMFTALMGHVGNFLSADINIAQVHKTGNPQVQEFVHFLSLFACNFLRNHLPLLEHGDESCRGAILAGLSFLLRISLVDDVVIFKICLEFWLFLVTDIYNSQKAAMLQQQPGLLLGRAFGAGARSPRLQVYAPSSSSSSSSSSSTCFFFFFFFFYTYIYINFMITKTSLQAHFFQKK